MKNHVGAEGATTDNFCADKVRPTCKSLRQRRRRLPMTSSEAARSTVAATASASSSGRRWWRRWLETRQGVLSEASGRWAPREATVCCSPRGCVVSAVDGGTGGTGARYERIDEVNQCVSASVSPSSKPNQRRASSAGLHGSRFMIMRLWDGSAGKVAQERRTGHNQDRHVQRGKLPTAVIATE